MSWQVAGYETDADKPFDQLVREHLAGDELIEVG